MSSRTLPYADQRALAADLFALGDAILVAALAAQGPDQGLDHSADLGAQVHRDVQARWAALTARMAATRAAGIFLPWIHLAELFQLTRTEQLLLLVALLAGIDGRYRGLLCTLGDASEAADAEGTLPLGAAARLLGRGAVQQALASEAALRRWQLIELDPGARLTGFSTLSGACRLTPSIAAYLQATAAPQLWLGEALPTLRVSTDLDAHLVDPATLARLHQFIARCGPDEPGQLSYILHLQGPDSALLNSLCAATFARWGLGCVQLDARLIWQSHLAGQRSRPALIARLRSVCRDALLSNRVLAISQPQWLALPDMPDGAVAEGSEDLFECVWDTLLESQRYCVLLSGPAARLADYAHSYDAHPALPVLVHVPAPDAALRRRIWLHWASAQGQHLEPALLERLLSNYLFTQAQIRRVLRDAAGRALLAESGTRFDTLLLEACRDQNNAERLSIAKEVKTPYRLGDIVLPTATRRCLDEVLLYAQYRHQVIEQWGFDLKQPHSNNLCVLFHGPSGTGKTMAASVIANELALALFKVDLASVLSKYIGETEKHLAQLFDRAEAMNVVLFFDEAESLFSKRTEVRDAHDRYANLQTGYLLQRIENYPGLVILSTNLMKNMDKAFTRRFKFILEFSSPGVEERLRLWRNAFPAALPKSEDIDYELLAERASISGGHINNIAMRAAFLAAAEQQPLALRHILSATEREYDKLGKVFAAADFAWGDDD